MAIDNATRQMIYRERRSADALVLVRAYVPKALATRARRLAKKEGCPQSQIVARAYALGVEQLEKPKPQAAAPKPKKPKAKSAKAQPKQPNKPKKKPEAQAVASKPESSKKQRRRVSKERRRQRHKEQQRKKGSGKS